MWVYEEKHRKRIFKSSSGRVLPNLELTCFWLMCEGFHLQSVVLSRKSSYCEYELQPTVVVCWCTVLQKKWCICFPSDTGFRRTNLQIFSILCGGLPIWALTKGKNKFVVYRCWWLHFSMSQSRCLLVSRSSSNPTANSSDSDSVCLESTLPLEFWTHKQIFFWFVGFNGNSSCPSAAAAGCQIHYNPYTWEMNFPSRNSASKLG